VIAGGDDVDAEFEKFLGDLRSDTEAAGGVLAVGDGEIDRVLLPQLGQALVHDGPAWPAKNVSDEEYSQVATFLWRFDFDGNMRLRDGGPSLKVR
jgi:hypothetical protein